MKTAFYKDPHIMGGLLVVLFAIILRHAPATAQVMLSADFQDILTGLALAGFISARNASGKVGLKTEEDNANGN